MNFRRLAVFAAVALLPAGLAIPIGRAQQSPPPVKAVQLTGLEGVKNNVKGALSVENGHLHFVHDKASTDVAASSMEDVVTGADSEEAIGKTLGLLSMAAPYGGGRFLSLFRTKIDTLTIQYRDADGGLHGVIFTMGVGSADLIKKQLVAQGAHTTIAGEPNKTPVASNDSAAKEQKQ